jgi:antitoxin (DNA-binding transcriptional repressor) of toxin-antitoxin stability system
MRVITPLDLRRSLGAILDAASAGERFVVERDHRPLAVIVSVEEGQRLDPDPEALRLRRLAALDRLESLRLRMASDLPPTAGAAAGAGAVAAEAVAESGAAGSPGVGQPQRKVAASAKVAAWAKVAASAPARAGAGAVSPPTVAQSPPTGAQRPHAVAASAEAGRGAHAAAAGRPPVPPPPVPRGDRYHAERRRHAAEDGAGFDG